MSVPDRADQGAGDGEASFRRYSDGRRANRPFLMVLAAVWATILLAFALVTTRM
jgi:hypothetical protein